jgi:hypothetical protein
MERETGIEPATSSLGSWRSTAELLPLMTTARLEILRCAQDFASGLSLRSRPLNSSSWRSTAELLPLSWGTNLAYHHLPAVTTIAGHAVVGFRLARTVELALDRTAEGGCPYIRLIRPYRRAAVLHKDQRARELVLPFVLK